MKKYLKFASIVLLLVLLFAIVFYLTSDLLDDGKKIYSFVKVNGLLGLRFRDVVEILGWFAKTAINIFLIQFFYSLYELTIKKLIEDVLVKSILVKFWNDL